MTFTNWTPAEPNDANGAEDFAFMNWTDSSGNVGWNDEPEPGAVIAIIELASAGSWNVVVPDDAATIAGALALVNAGGIVHVRAGTYAGGFVIDKPMTLEGEGWGNTVIDSAGTNIGVTVQTNGAILRAFKVIATAPTIAIRFISASNNTLDHVWTDGGRSGVSFYGGSNDNLAVDSRASNAAECGFEGGDTGSSGNTYRRVEAYGNQGGIVSYAGSDRTTVQDSNLHDNRGAGFQIGWSSGWSITGTTLTHNLNGLFIDSATSGTAFGNYISLNANHGVLLSGLGQSNDTIRGNQIHGNGAVGIRLASHSIGNVISGNVIDGNATGVLVDRNEGAPNYGNTFDHNTFTGNTVNARADEERYGGNHWDSGYPVGGNVWDDATGTDQFSGPGQDVPGPDGFLDAPRAIPGASDVDRYPFAHQAPPAGPRFTVDRGRQPAYAFIDGQQFMPGDAIAIRLNGTPLGALNADPDGNFWFNLPGDQDPPITILPGDTVAVSSGSQTKTHVVTHLQITGVEGNVISGIADTATVHLWIWDTQVDRHVAVTGGHWSVDVGTPGGPGETATTTLGPGSGISAEELDEDGDGTQADYEVPNPRFTLRPNDDSIEASGFAPNADLLVNRNGTPIDTQSTTFGPYGDAWFGSPVDLKVGDTIAVGDGTTTKTLLVSAVEISGIVGNVISGRADGDWVEVWVADTEVHRFLPVAADHTWSTDVGAPGPDPEDSATTTLVPGSGIGAQEFDGDGDATAVDTWIPNPRISVNPADGWINGVEFPIGAAVTIELNGQKVVDGSMTVDENGEIWFGPENEIRPGDTVAVSAGGVSKSTVVTHLTVDTDRRQRDQRPRGRRGAPVGRLDRLSSQRDGRS